MQINMQNDFSYSTPSQIIATQINLILSLLEFFSYEMDMCGRGIKELEMLRSQEDWDPLRDKLLSIEKLLSPILGNLDYL